MPEEGLSPYSGGDMKKDPESGPERRSYFRITYGPDKRPVLTVGKNEFEIADVSEGGIRLISSENIVLEKPVRGAARFLYGETVDIEGDIVWEQNGELGLLLKNYIPSAVMEKEKRYVILDNG